MKIDESMNIVIKLEDMFKVDEWEIEGIHIWPIIRGNLAYHLSMVGEDKSIYNIPLYKKVIEKLLLAIKSIISVISAFFLDYNNNSTLKKANVMFLTNSGCRRYLKDFWYDFICDPIIDFMEKYDLSYEIIEFQKECKYRWPRYNKSYFIQFRLLIIRLKSLINSKNGSHDYKLEGFEEFINVLKSYNFDIPIPNINDLRFKVLYIKNMSVYFKKLIRIVNPKLALVTIYYGIEDMAFLLACREENIISVEVQHGLQYEYHPNYAKWTKVPKNGYEIMPAIFWNWDHEASELINSWIKDANVSNYHQAIPLGNMWLEMWKNNSDVSNYYKDILSINKIKINGIKVLITVQYGCTEFELPQWIVDTIRQAPSDWHWSIRLHPVMIDNKEDFDIRLKTNGIKNYEINQATIYPLPLLLKNVDIHVTACSSSIIEAQHFGVPSVMTFEPAVDMFDELIKDGWVLTAYNSEDLINAIKQQHNNRENLKQAKSNDSIYEHNRNKLIAMAK